MNYYLNSILVTKIPSKCNTAAEYNLSENANERIIALDLGILLYACLLESMH